MNEIISVLLCYVFFMSYGDLNLVFMGHWTIGFISALDCSIEVCVLLLGIYLFVIKFHLCSCTEEKTKN